MKVCRTCEELKPLDQFYCDSTKSDGRRGQCIECEKKRKRGYFQRRGKYLQRERRRKARMMTKEELIAELEGRLGVLPESGSVAGQRRALRMALDYLATARGVSHAQVVLQRMLEKERGRPGEFWADSYRTLERIVKRLEGVREDEEHSTDR